MNGQNLHLQLPANGLPKVQYQRPNKRQGSFKLGSVYEQLKSAVPTGLQGENGSARFVSIPTLFNALLGHSNLKEMQGNVKPPALVKAAHSLREEWD